PATLVSHTYRYSDRTISFYPNGIAKLRIPSGSTFTSFSAVNRENVWKVELQDAQVRLQLTFDPSGGGAFLEESSLGALRGEFVEIPDPDAETGGPYPAPVVLSHLRIRLTQSVLGPGPEYLVTLSGGASGTFVVTGAMTG